MRETDRWMDGHIDRQTDRQTDRQIDRQREKKPPIWKMKLIMIIKLITNGAQTGKCTLVFLYLYWKWWLLSPWQTAIHYSSLFAKDNETTSSWKNLNFAKHGENASTDYLSPWQTATHYSSLFAKDDETTSSRKNLKFVKHGENASTDYLSSAAVFASNMQIQFTQQKMPLCFIETPLRRAKIAQNKKLVCETSAKMLYTRFLFRSIFISSSIFCSCLRMVCTGLMLFSNKIYST